MVQSEEIGVSAVGLAQQHSSQEVPASAVTRSSKTDLDTVSASAQYSDSISQHPALAMTAAELTPAVRRALKHLADEVSSLKAERARLADRLRRAEELADRDTLVPVYNRRAFVRELDRIISFAARYEVQASLVYFDLNGFKQINDRFGHPAGDAILQAVGKALLDNVRDSDLVGRVGGDEFAVILAQSSPEDAVRKGTQLADAISKTQIDYLGHRLTISAAFGAYCLEADDTGERALSRADEAMYADKGGHKIQSL
ncbi:GGDEF domain-containing protein [Candidatus Phycosocius spiralis]|uniref:diguanylate cyclase n=1 Tax=Candidatus Phycosocius spiralis TaxID=2815099 RepID=A0ABQ4PU34_9PROT|nr:GGDEF domain-containing protein [Candidatus Phycosocius spiralis]GIU66414.1 GGDEF domain-containing protein [Candidatus Phycosocius spiralis]